MFNLEGGKLVGNQWPNMGFECKTLIVIITDILCNNLKSDLLESLELS